MKILSNKASIVLLGHAFRPLFFVGALYAIVSIAVWLLLIQGVTWKAAPDIQVSWHAHEMIYGFVAAIIAGYLFTTVSRFGTNKLILIGLILTWFIGRAAMLSTAIVPTLFLFMVDMLFPLGLALLVVWEIVAKRNIKFYLLVPILLLFPTINVVFHFSPLETTRMMGLLFLNHMIILMITVVGGYLIPSLTLSWLRGKKSQTLPVSNRYLETGVIVSTILTALLDVFFPESPLLLLTACITAVLHLIRLLAWRYYLIFSNFPLLIIHTAYAWIVIAYFILAFNSFIDGFNHSTAMHAFNVGTIGTMILTVMARLSIRSKLRLVTVSLYSAFIIMLLSSLIRLLASFYMTHHTMLIIISGTFWALAFALFLIAFSISTYISSKHKTQQ